MRASRAVVYRVNQSSPSRDHGCRLMNSSPIAARSTSIRRVSWPVLTPYSSRLTVSASYESRSQIECSKIVESDAAEVSRASNSYEKGSFVHLGQNRTVEIGLSTHQGVISTSCSSPAATDPPAGRLAQTGCPHPSKPLELHDPQSRGNTASVMNQPANLGRRRLKQPCTGCRARVFRPRRAGRDRAKPGSPPRSSSNLAYSGSSPRFST